MIIKANLHTHTTYCDGKLSPRQMAECALEKGIETLGFSFHSYTPFDLSYCIRNEDKYLVEIDLLKKEYEGRLAILSGIELDYYGRALQGADYVIGSVHYLIGRDGKYYAVDLSAAETQNCIEFGFGGDVVAMVTAYYDNVVNMYTQLKPTIIGHFDLITRFNRNVNFFDEKAVWYVELWQNALDRLLAAAPLFEVNMGSIYRGHRSEPYPSWQILKRIAEKGGRVMLSSDAHDCGGLGFMFDEALEKLRELGFASIKYATKDGFADYKL